MRVFFHIQFAFQLYVIVWYVQFLSLNVLQLLQVWSNLNQINHYTVKPLNCEHHWD